MQIQQYWTQACISNRPGEDRPDGTIPASLIHLQSISHESSMMQKQKMKKPRVSSSSFLSNSIKIKENQGDKL
jgi:hypothetical protein